MVSIIKKIAFSVKKVFIGYKKVLKKLSQKN